MSPDLVAFGILLTLAILGVIVCVTEDERDTKSHCDL
jgi:hypothetical protein